MKTKTPQEIYAQTAAFVDVQPYEYKTTLTHRLGEVATSLLAGESVVAQSTEDSGIQGEIVLTEGDYLEFLRHASPEDRADIAFLADKMSAYPRFNNRVNNVLKHEDSESDVLSAGQSSAKVYSLKQDGNDYAVKDGGYSYNSIRAFRIGDSIDRIAHLKAIKPDEGILIMDRLPGKPMTSLTFAEHMAIPTEHIRTAIKTVIRMNEAGLEIDAHPDNLLYDPEQGFGVVDYAAKPSPEPWPNYRSKANQIMSWANMFALFPKQDESTIPESGTQGYADWDLKMAQERIQLFDKFFDVMEESYPDVLQQAANENDWSINGSYMHFPSGEYLDAFKSRLQHLGLGTE